MNDPNPARQVNGAVAVGGAAGGTALVAVVQAIGPSTVGGEILTFLTPVLTVALGYGSYLLQGWFDRLLARQRAKNESDEYGRALVELRKLAKSRHTSPELKSQIKKQLEEVDSLVADRAMTRLRSSFQPTPQAEVTSNDLA
jgi:hypothetical protein